MGGIALAHFRFGLLVGVNGLFTVVTTKSLTFYFHLAQSIYI